MPRNTRQVQSTMPEIPPQNMDIDEPVLIDQGEINEANSENNLTNELNTLRINENKKPDSDINLKYYQIFREELANVGRGPPIKGNIPQKYSYLTRLFSPFKGFERYILDKNNFDVKKDRVSGLIDYSNDEIIIKQLEILSTVYDNFLNLKSNINTIAFFASIATITPKDIINAILRYSTENTNLLIKSCLEFREIQYDSGNLNVTESNLTTDVINLFLSHAQYNIVTVYKKAQEERIIPAFIETLSQKFQIFIKQFRENFRCSDLILQLDSPQALLNASQEVRFYKYPNNDRGSNFNSDPELDNLISQRVHHYMRINYFSPPYYDNNVYYGNNSAFISRPYQRHRSRFDNSYYRRPSQYYSNHYNPPNYYSRNMNPLDQRQTYGNTYNNNFRYNNRGRGQNNYSNNRGRYNNNYRNYQTGQTQHNNYNNNTHRRSYSNNNSRTNTLTSNKSH